VSDPVKPWPYKIGENKCEDKVGNHIAAIVDSGIKPYVCSFRGITAEKDHTGKKMTEEPK
jgi:hypothetical protein